MADPFTWYELMTPDPKGAESFYDNLVGWTSRDVGTAATGNPYTVFMPPAAGDKGVAGMLATPPGAKAGWVGYIYVDDVDAYVKRVTDAGGVMHREPTDVPGMLRFAVFADPQGAPFVLMTPLPPMDGSGAEHSNTTELGHIGWRELVSTDWEAAWSFYSGLFGWTKTDSMDMGPIGTYQMFATGGDTVGAMMTGPKESPVPYWNYYFNVDSIDAAIKRLTETGGKVVMGPHEVPGPMWIVQALDPQGVMVSLVSDKP